MTAPRGVVKTSLGVERAHVGSAIELRYRRPIATAFFATQERFTFYHGSCVGVPIPMRKPPTGEPCAGELHARFGGRGRRKSFPTLSKETFSDEGSSHSKKSPGRKSGEIY